MSSDPWESLILRHARAYRAADRRRDGEGMRRALRGILDVLEDAKGAEDVIGEGQDQARRSERPRAPAPRLDPGRPANVTHGG